ncbi:MAG: Hpt domain-containing protein [Desulfovibrionaceae bacterium]
MTDAPISPAWFEKMQGKEAFVQRLFEVFLREEPQRVNKIKAAVKGADLAQVKFLAHSLKGAAATMGAEPLRDCCLRLELAAKSNDPLQSAEAMSCLEREIGRVYTCMRERMVPTSH